MDGVVRIRKRLTFKEVKSYIESFDYVLLSKEYINAHTKMKLKCPNGHIYESSYGNFRKSKCNDCAMIIRTNKLKKYKYEDVKAEFKKNRCELLEDDYKNTKTPMKYKCECGNISKINFYEFRKGKRCRKCMGERLSSVFRFKYEDVKNYFEKHDCTLLSTSYKNGKQKLDYICKCGNRSNIAFHKFKKGQRCQNCRNNKISIQLKGREYPERRGENHHNWSDTKTDEERFTERKYTDYQIWRKSVLSRDYFTCQCCNQVGGRLVAHHKDGYHWCKERRTDISNGFTLCVECHNEFHKTYGKWNNTEQQYYDFLNYKSTLK